MWVALAISLVLHPLAAVVYALATPEPPPILYVSVGGKGSGQVISKPAGIVCGDDCNSEVEDGTLVTLTAVLAKNSTFEGWSDNCAMQKDALTCTITVTETDRVEARFGLIPDKVDVSWVRPPPDKKKVKVTLPRIADLARLPKPKIKPPPPVPKPPPPEKKVAMVKPEPPKPINLLPKPKPPEPPKKKKPVKVDPPKMKSVEVKDDDHVVAETPDDATFLSDKNRDVSEQTQAKDTNLERASEGKTPYSEESDVQSDDIGAAKTEIAQLEETEATSLEAEREKESPKVGDDKEAIGARAGQDGESGEDGQAGTADNLAPPGLLSTRGIERSDPLGRLVPENDGEVKEKKRGRIGAHGRIGIKTQLSFEDYKRIVGEDKVRKEVALGRRTMSKKRGRWEKKQEAVKAALENFVPEVKPGNQTALKTRAAPFAVYIARMHRRIHELWGFGFLKDLAAKPSSNPLNDWELRTNIEIVINPDGTVDKTTIVVSSGLTMFDVAAIDTILTAAPFEPPPEKIRSADGKVYLHWWFNRNWRQCGTFGAQPFILSTPPSDADTGPGSGLPTPTRAATGPSRPVASTAGARAAAARASSNVPAPDDPDAVQAANLWLTGFVQGDVNGMVSVSQSPFRSGGQVVANSSAEIASVYQTVLSESSDRRPRDWHIFSAAGYRQRFGALPPGVDQAAVRLYLVIKLADQQFTLILADAGESYRVVGLNR